MNLFVTRDPRETFLHWPVAVPGLLQMAKGLRSKRLKRNKNQLRDGIFSKIEAERLTQVVEHEKQRNRFDINMSVDLPTNPSDQVMADGSERSRKKKKSAFSFYGVSKRETRF